MKVIILGACGGMGRYVAKSISSFQEIDNLGIADLNIEDAEILASKLGPHTNGIGVNINRDIVIGSNSTIVSGMTIFENVPDSSVVKFSNTISVITKK